MLKEIEAILRSRGLVATGWADEMAEWGERVALYGRYYDGDHKTYLSDEMKAMLRSQMGFAGNYCELVVSSMADRLVVTAITGDDDGANEWAGELLGRNRFDSLQIDLTEAVLRDGDAFILAEYAEGGVVWSVEEAWNGHEGMMVVYDEAGRDVLAAVKVWWDAAGRWVRLYFQEETIKYSVDAAYLTQERITPDDVHEQMASGMVGGLREVGREAWQPGRVPVVHFKNRAARRSRRGHSEMKAAIPLNDALNRTMVSMVMTGELNGFPIRVAKGFKAPATVRPGMWLTIGGEEGLQKDDVADAYTLENGEVIPYIQTANFIIDTMAAITKTPLPQLSGSVQESGEAKKENEKGLLGKVGKAQTKLGNAYEDLMVLSGTIEGAYGSADRAAGVRWRATWEDAQVRNDAEVVANAMAVRELVGDRETLRLVAPVFGYEEADIDRILAERQAEASNRLAALGGSLPGFEQFNVGTG